MDISDGIGLPSWRLALCLFGAWVIVFLVISRGVKSSGKCSYFLALFPYVIMLALLVRSVTLEGASKGILFFLTPKWHELSNPKVSHIWHQMLHINLVCLRLHCAISKKSSSQYLLEFIWIALYFRKKNKNAKWFHTLFRNLIWKSTSIIFIRGYIGLECSHSTSILQFIYWSLSPRCAIVI